VLHAGFAEKFYFLYNIKAMDRLNINLHTQTPRASSYGELSGQNNPHQAQATPLRHRASIGQLFYPAEPSTPAYSDTPTYSPYNGTYTPTTQSFLSHSHPTVSTSQLANGTSTSRVYRTKAQKIEAVLDTIQENRLTLDQFLKIFFEVPSPDKKIRRSHWHATAASRFLRGENTYHVADILECWLRSPDGRPRSNEDHKQMLSPSIPFTDIRPARPAITSFAVQVVEKRLLYERQQASKPSSGLHAVTNAQSGDKAVIWDAIGSGTVAEITASLQTSQPLTFHYLSQLATPKPRKRNGVVVQRKTRPPEIVRTLMPHIRNQCLRLHVKVTTHVLSTLNFSFSENICRLLKIQGILYFACGAPTLLFSTNSRIGNTPAYSTIYRTLEGLSKQQAKDTEEMGRHLNKWPIIRFDNVQSYSKRRDLQIGRVNQMRIGTAGTAVEMEDYNPAAMDVDDRLAQVAENKRKDLTVDSLHALIDHEHLDCVGALQWLRTLVHYIPELRNLKGKVSELYRTKGTKKQINPNRKSKIYPLATNAKNEAKTTELKDALLDFFGQLGQRQGDYIRRLLIAGGDGATFDMMVQLKRYMQFHEDDFESFALLVPLLELWHLA
jgi:hypothetical protein